MNAEKILNNKLTYYNLTQEFNLSDTLTNLIKGELEINSNSSGLFNVNFYNSLHTLNVVKNLQSQDVNNEENNYVPLKPIDFEISSSFKLSPIKISEEKKNKNLKNAANPRILGYSKKRRSNNINKHNPAKSKFIKGNSNIDNNITVISNPDNQKNVINLIDDVKNENVFSDPIILDKNTQTNIIDSYIYNLQESSNNVEKDTNAYCNNAQNKNILSPSMVHKTFDKSKINNNNNVKNTVDIQRLIGNIQNEKLIIKIKPMTQEKNFGTAAVDDFDNSDQEIIIEEEFIIDNNKLIPAVKKDNIISTPLTLEENYETVAIDKTDNSDEETVIEEEFTINESYCYVNNENEVLLSMMTSEKNYEMTAGDNTDNSDQEIVIEEEFTIDDSKPICDVKNKNNISTSINSEENYEIISVDNTGNSDQEIVIEEEFTIDDNKPNCDVKNKNNISTSINSEENYEIISDDNTGNSDQEIIIEEEIIVSQPISNVKNENIFSIPTIINKNNEVVAVEHTHDSGHEIIIKKTDDVQNENVLSMLSNFINNNSTSIFNHTENDLKIDDIQNDNILPIFMNFINNDAPTVINNADNTEIENDLQKSIDEISTENIFTIPVTPVKSTHSSSEKSDPLYITPVKELNKNSLGNLTSLSQELNSDEEYDKLCNEKLLNIPKDDKIKSIYSDSEFERMCDTIQNNSMETARFSFETIELLNEFNKIDQSTNNNLLTELLESPKNISSNRKNQDYMITVDPLIDHSTSVGSVSDTSDESDLGIEVKSKHIKKMIKINAERKKFLKLQKKFFNLKNKNLTIDNENKFDKRKKCTDYTISTSRRRRLKSNGSINYNEDSFDDYFDDDDYLPVKTTKSKVKRKRTKKVYNNIEGKRNSRLLKKSIDKENSQNNIGNCVNNQNMITKLPIIRLRRINTLKLQGNTENGSISENNPENELWTMNFDESFYENEKILNSNDVNTKVNQNISNRFFSDENQKNYDQLTDMSMINTNGHLADKSITNDVVVNTKIKKGLSQKKITNYFSSKRDLSRKKSDNHDKNTNLNSITEKCENERSCNEIQENMDNQPTEVNKESKLLQETSFVGRKIKISAKMKEFLNDKYQSNLDENIVSSSTEQKYIKKSPSKLKMHKNLKSQDLPTSSNDNKLLGVESEIFDVADNYDFDSSDSLSSEISVKSQKSDSNNMNETDEIIDKTIKKIIYLKIKFEHEVPKQHQLEKRIIIEINSELKAEFSKYAELHLGHFKVKEVEILRKNWERFCEVHKLDPNCSQLILQKYNDYKSLIAFMKNKIKFLQFLARDLPNRLLSQVYRKFRVLYSKKEKRERKKNSDHFSVGDDRLIKSYLYQNESNFEKSLKELSESLNRPESLILERFNELKNRKAGIYKKEKRNIEWEIPLAEKFIKEFMEVTLSDDIEDLKYAKIPACVWIELEKRLNIPKSKLKQLWFCQLHMQLFSSKCIFSSDIRIMLIEYLYIKGISDREQIDWPVIAEHFDGVTTEYLSRIFSQMLASVPFTDKDKNLLECIEWLYEEKISRIVKMNHDFYLPRLIYKNKKLEIINDYCNENDAKMNYD